MYLDIILRYCVLVVLSLFLGVKKTEKKRQTGKSSSDWISYRCVNIETISMKEICSRVCVTWTTSSLRKCEILVTPTLWSRIISRCKHLVRYLLPIGHNYESYIFNGNDRTHIFNASMGIGLSFSLLKKLIAFWIY